MYMIITEQKIFYTHEWGSPFDIDITHGISSHYRDLVQEHVHRVVDDHTQNKLVRFSWGNVDGGREGPLLGKYVHPHVQRSLCVE